MKLKTDFVTNSSSTSFIITNISNEKKDLVDFVKENPQLIQEFVERYAYQESDRYTQERLLRSAKLDNIEFNAGESKLCVFGDEDGTVIGEVFDYILRDGGSSESFMWHFNEYYR